jgi:hypothetical protein
MHTGGTHETPMSEPHATPGPHDEPAQAPEAHDAAAEHDDEHGHDSMTLGPVDWQMWGVGVLGVVVALIITAGFAIATDFQFNA